MCSVVEAELGCSRLDVAVHGFLLINGQTEGQITRLKLIKRQMYGRAKLDLLQARLVGVR
jgi:transposase